MVTVRHSLVLAQSSVHFLPTIFGSTFKTTALASITSERRGTPCPTLQLSWLISFHRGFSIPELKSRTFACEVFVLKLGVSKGIIPSFLDSQGLNLMGGREHTLYTKGGVYTVYYTVYTIQYIQCTVPGYLQDQP